MIRQVPDEMHVFIDRTSVGWNVELILTPDGVKTLLRGEWLEWHDGAESARSKIRHSGIVTETGARLDIARVRIVPPGSDAPPLDS